MVRSDDEKAVWLRAISDGSEMYWRLAAVTDSPHNRMIAAAVLSVPGSANAWRGANGWAMCPSRTTYTNLRRRGCVHAAGGAAGVPANRIQPSINQKAGFQKYGSRLFCVVVYEGFGKIVLERRRLALDVDLPYLSYLVLWRLGDNSPH